MPSSVAITIHVDTKGLKKFIKSGEFKRVLNKHVSRQLIGFGTFVKAELKRRIRGNQVAGALLGVQKYIKGHGRLLVHTSKFVEAARFKYHKEQIGLTGIQVGWFEGQSDRGLAYPELAKILEGGRTWVPTDKERMAVAIKAREAGAPKPTGKRKEVWRIPARPVLGNLLRDRVVLRKFDGAAREALDRTLKELMS